MPSIEIKTLGPVQLIQEKHIDVYMKTVALRWGDWSTALQLCRQSKHETRG
jgi:hypothetical protein